MTPPSEGESQAIPRPMPCPECGSTKGYNTGGPFRVHCRGCGSLVPREQVDMQLPTEESTS
jgi:hypothetical protein